jgi:hypothetical protein
MKSGDLVRVGGSTGIIIECQEGPYWGETAKILFFDGTYSEWEKAVLEFLYPLKLGGYGIVPPKRLNGIEGFDHSGKVER